MNNQIEQNIAKNIVELRKLHNMKQAELGEKINYSDKTISKWENGFSVPDVTALSVIAELFNITIDDLIKENAVDKATTKASHQIKEIQVDKIAMACLSVVSVFTIAILMFFAADIVRGYYFWTVFVWAIPPSAFLIYKFNKNNTNIKWLNTLSLSIFSWGILTATYLQLLSYNLWHLFILGVPLQIMIGIYTLFRKKPPSGSKAEKKKKRSK